MKTQELNEKLQAADKGDLLDFKLDGSSVQTFDGVDYSRSALNKAKADAEMLGLFDIGKRERKEANYNENSIYKQQMTALQTKTPTKKKAFKLPKYLRLPRMEEWQMYDREALFKIQEDEESAFKSLPEEYQKRATAITKDAETANEAEFSAAVAPVDSTAPEPEGPFELPPLLSEERQAEKDKLLAEGFSEWKRHDYTLFIKASATHGRDAIDKVALEVGKSDVAVREFAAAFWGETGKTRVAEHEYDRVTKLIERGEKKIEEMKNLERATRILVSHFDDPWAELEFTHVNCKDKMFTADEDRHLICWARKVQIGSGRMCYALFVGFTIAQSLCSFVSQYGYGQWMAIKNAVRRNPTFRFDYFLRSLPVDLLGRRCEQLMKAAEKEVEQLERSAREAAGLSVEPEKEGEALPPIVLPQFRVMQQQRRLAQKTKAEQERQELEEKVAEIEAQVRVAQNRLKALSEGVLAATVSPLPEDSHASRSKVIPAAAAEGQTIPGDASGHTDAAGSENGDIGPDGEFVEFPPYDGSEPPVEWKKAFTQYCNRTKKDLKASLDPVDRKNKVRSPALAARFG